LCGFARLISRVERGNRAFTHSCAGWWFRGSAASACQIACYGIVHYWHGACSIVRCSTELPTSIETLIAPLVIVCGWQLLLVTEGGSLKRGLTMYCRICGDEKDVRYYAGKRQSLCRSCAKDTPAKVSRTTFDRVYWTGCEENDPPEGIRREFYADYLASRHGSVASYIEATTSYTL
jgi:hypothetical protein